VTGRRTAAAVLLCGSAILAQSPDARRSAGYPAYERADKLFAAQKYQECMNALDEALRLDSNLVPALTLRSKLAMSINRFDVARKHLERAIAADPASSYAQFLYGFLLYRQNELPAAITALERARQLNPRDAAAALYLGLSKESLGNTADALVLYRDAIRLEEAAGHLHVDTMMPCARLLLVLGEFEEEERLLDRAMKIAPDARAPQFEACRLWLRKGDPARAAKEGEIALGLRGDITDRQIHYLLVQAYQAAGRNADAERHAAAVHALEQGK
jgi:tetratricopeptide (TPR) repeat protein